MALHDIVSAIVADADQRIAEALAAHQQHLHALRAAGEQKTTRMRAEIAEQRENRKKHMKERAEGHARAMRNQAILGKKQSHIDGVYAEVLRRLVGLPDDAAQKLLKACLERVTDADMVIHPSTRHEALLRRLAPNARFGEPIRAAGGFRAVSAAKEADFTFEFLVEGILRPATDLETARELFPFGH